MKRFIIILLITTLSATSQDIHFSQYKNSTFFTNPSFTSFQGSDYHVLLQKRNQWQVVADPFSTFLMSIESKKILNNNSFGIHFMNDIAGDARYQTTGSIINYSKLIRKNYTTFFGLEKDLKPMKLSDIAQIVGVDISTISRASNSKYIETHFGTFKIKELFSEAYRKDNGEIISTKEIKTTLLELINNENKSKPFTDDELADLLGKEDYHIARRTTAKYRESLKIPVSRLRKKL